MKLNTIIAGALLALGLAVGMNASALTLHECCRILQEECELNTPGQCKNVYEGCVKSRHCILN